MNCDLHPDIDHFNDWRAVTDEAPPSFGIWLRAEREALGLFQYSMADALGYSPFTVARWESDQEVPARMNLIRLAIDGLKYRREADPTMVSTEIVALGVAIEAAKRRAQ
jgi:DNA-binding transcriptional regulator YiaG|tara:strand:- start:820 stop:1146 length:327 start_codon:yes stop_codon:yes gene_type:complete